MSDKSVVVPEPKFKPIDKTSLSEEIAGQIMELIASGALTPGEKLPSERELRLRFGVGRSSLREALRCLTIVGVLKARAGEGTYLSLNRDKFIGKVLEWRVATERKNVENLMKVRLALETETATNAALNATDEQIKELEDALEEMKRALSDSQRFVAADVAFHLLIAKISSNELIFDLLSLIRSQLQRAFLALGNRPNSSQDALEEHCQILDAIRRHDSEAATVLMREHIHAGLKRYQHALTTEVARH